MVAGVKRFMVELTTATDQSVPVVTGFTVRPAFAVCERLPLSPVTVSVELPVVVELSVVIFNVELPEPVTEAGLKLPLAPLGKPETLNTTFPLKLFCGVTETV